MLEYTRMCNLLCVWLNAAFSIEAETDDSID